MHDVIPFELMSKGFELSIYLKPVLFSMGAQHLDVINNTSNCKPLKFDTSRTYLSSSFGNPTEQSIFSVILLDHATYQRDSD